MELYLEGTIAAKAALQAQRRELYELLLRKGGKPRKGDPELRRLAQQRDVPARDVDAEEIDALAAGKTHGGVLLRAGPRLWQDAVSLPQGDAPLLFCLEGVEDPFNLGQSIRSLWACGVQGVLLPQRDWSFAEAAIARASAGAWDLMPISPLSPEAADSLIPSGIRILCAEGTPKAKPLHKADLSGPLLLCIGGERRGISRFLTDRASGLLRIPYGRMYNQSLPTTAAASIVAYEALRQRL